MKEVIKDIEYITDQVHAWIEKHIPDKDFDPAKGGLITVIFIVVMIILIARAK